MLNSTQTCQITFLLFDRFSNMVLANVLEPFRAANTLSGRNHYTWSIQTVDGRDVSSSSGLTIRPDEVPRSKSDFLFVLSSYGFRAQDTPRTRALLRKVAGQAGVVGGLDAGAWLLASSGLLNGKRATLHPDVWDAFSEQFPDVTLERKGHVSDGKWLSCGGAMSGFEMTLGLIGDHLGEGLRRDVAALFQQPSGTETLIPAKSKLVRQALALMGDAIEMPLEIPEIAHRLGVGQRQLERQMKRELSITPVKAYRHVRLTHVRQLLEATDLPMSEISIRSGYESASAMTRAFRLEFGQTPTAYRATR